MRHRCAGTNLGRPSDHRKALLQNLAKSLLTHETMKTTVTKAKVIRPIVEKLVTLARVDTVANRRQARRLLRNDDTLLHKLFTEIAPRFAGRPGGYLRIVKCGYRDGDTAPAAIIQFVDKATEAV